MKPTQSDNTLSPERDFTVRRIAISIVFYTNGLAAGCWAVLVPVIISNLEIAEAQMGLIILAGGLAGVFALAASPLNIALFGGRNIILFATLMLCLGLVLIVNTQSFWMAILVSAIAMASLATQDVAMNADAGELENEIGRTIMSSFHGFWSGGAMTGALLAGPILAHTGPTILTVCLGVVISAMVLFAAPHLSSKATSEQDAMSRTLPKALLPWLFAIIAFSGFVAEGAVLDWSAQFFRKELASGVSLSGFAFGAFSLTMMLARFSGDRLREKFGDQSVFLVSVLIAAIGMVLVVIAPTVTTATLGFALAGFGNANIVPVAFSAASRLKNLPKGAGIAAAAFGGYAGLLFAPAGLGNVGELYGFRIVYALMAALLLATLLLLPALAKASKDNA